MIIKEFTAPNPEWDITSLECEKTGVTLHKHNLKHKGIVCYRLIDGDDINEEISEKVFESVKNLLT